MNRQLYFLFFLLFVGKLVALVPPLEREINLTLSNESVSSALLKIQSQTGLVFSYRHDIVDNLAPVTIQIKQKTVREALSIMLPKSILFKQRSNYIILKEKPIQKNQKNLELTGYVIDRTTEKKVPNVTIYDRTTLKVVTTDEYGFYSITVPNENQCIKVNKENYRDTCISLNQDNAMTNITIDQIKDAINAKDSVSWEYKLNHFSRYTNDIFKKFRGHINTLNVKDSISRKAQFSVFPFVGSNGLLSGNVYNTLSFNLIGGYSRGSKLLEVAGVFNVNKEKMNGTQAAGAFNIVGDSVKGMQLAGLFNVTGRSMIGLQGAGFINLNIGSVKGVQAAGFTNVNVGNVKGIEMAGLANFNAKNVNGMLLAGFLNVTRKSVNGSQAAGVLNITGDTLSGSAIAGFANLSWYSKNSFELAGTLNHAQFAKENVQISSFMNTTSKGTTRFQLATFLNLADHLTGVQLGFVNYSDTATGVPIGLLSIVKNGVHQFELSSDELFRYNFGFRTGVSKFYNVFNLGFASFNQSPVWSMGYGLGTSFKIKKKLRSDITVTANHVSSGQLYHATSELYKFYWGFEYKFFNKFSFAAGPTVNFYWSDALLPDYKTIYSNIIPYHSYNYSLSNNFNLKVWYGFKAALRFL